MPGILMPPETLFSSRCMCSRLLVSAALVGEGGPLQIRVRNPKGETSSAATLLVFAGVWALMKGITDVVRAFQMRELGSS